MGSVHCFVRAWQYQVIARLFKHLSEPCKETVLFLKKLNVELAYNLAIPLADMCPRNWKRFSSQHTYTHAHGNVPQEIVRWPITDAQTNMMWHSHIRSVVWP